MRRLLQHTAILVATVLPLLVASCAGVIARDNIMLPAMSIAYDNGIYDNIIAGAEQESPATRVKLISLADRMGEALRSGDIAAVLRIDWPALQALAIVGIDIRRGLGSIGPGVAMSLQERVRLFHRSFQLLR